MRRSLTCTALTVLFFGPTLLAQDTIPSSTYVGCYRDQAARDLAGANLESSDMTPSRCQAFCLERGFGFAATQYGSQCYCGSSFGKYGQIADSECNMGCPGNSQEKCGGRWANSVYKLNGSVAQTLAAPSYRGCYRDRAARDLGGDTFDSPEMTSSRCQSFCLEKGFAFAATQYGSQCYCGNTFGNYGQIAESECSADCAGNHQEKCGGTWANSVYKLGRSEPPTQAEPSLGDLARQLREKNKTSGAKMVFSNDGMTTAPAVAAQVRLLGYRFSANRVPYNYSSYTGSCPVRLDFDWIMAGTGPTPVSYTFVRSDGGHLAGSRTVELPAGDPRAAILDDWTLGANNFQFANFSGWVELEIESPNPVSQRIPFTLHCTSETGKSASAAGASQSAIRVSGTSFRANQQVAPNSQYTGFCPVDLEFAWTLIAREPTTAIYGFARNDTPHPYRIPQTLKLAGANQPQSLTAHWMLGGNVPEFENFAGWMELDVEPPNLIAEKIPFTLHCTAAGGGPARTNGAASAPAPQKFSASRPPTPPLTSSLQGKVVDAATGQPLAGVPVWLSSYPKTITAHTGADGGFRLENVPSGQYQLEAGGTQIPEQVYSETADGRSTALPGPFQQGKVFYLVNGKQVRDVVFPVKSGCTIFGTVKDQDGRPIVGLNILAERPPRVSLYGTSSSGSGGAFTNPFGEYCVAGLGPGSYYLVAESSFGRAKTADGKELEPYVPTFYPGTTDARQAVPIPVKRDAASLKADLKLIRSRGVQVSGRVVDKSTGQPVPEAYVMLQVQDPRFLEIPGQMFENRKKGEPGSFQIPGVPPGSFRFLAVSGLPGEQRPGSEPPGMNVKNLKIGTASLEVKDQDVKDVQVRVSSGYDLAGRVRADPGVPIDFTHLEIGLVPTEFRMMPSGITEIQKDGTFIMHYLLEGHYRLHLEGFPPEFYPKSARLGEVNVFESGLDISETKPAGQLEIELALDGGRIDGTVFQNGKPVPEALVALVPDPPHRDEENLYSTANTDASGKFSMIGLPLGNFKLTARRLPQDFMMADYQYLQPGADKGTPVVIRARQSQTVRLELITDAGDE